MTETRASRGGRSGGRQPPANPHPEGGRIVRKRLPNPRKSSTKTVRTSAVRIDSIFIKKMPMKTIWTMPAMERVDLVKEGVPSVILMTLSRALDRPVKYVVRTIGMAPTSASRKLQRQTPLAPDESERALGVAKLIGQVETIVQQSGESGGFDPGKWVAEWIETPQPALGGRRPDELLDTAEGQRMVSDLLARMQSGAYS
jgi:putative toxin-antitoxin system antitoxin component (TIGR02293 family)